MFACAAAILVIGIIISAAYGPEWWYEPLSCLDMKRYLRSDAK